MQLSDWQMGRLRNAIRAYHCYGRSHDGDKFTWKDVSEAIVEYADTRVPPERLRQFVEGVRQKEGGIKHPVPKGERLQAIFDFAVHPDLELTSKEELTERNLDVQAALKLLDYLDQDFDGTRITPPQSIEGRYYCWRTELPFTCVSELVFDNPPATGIVTVHQTDRFFEDSLAPDNVAIALHGLPDNCKSEVRYGGWAILTPEDNFFLFLKEEGVGTNRYYFTLSTNLTHSGDIAMTEFSFLQHDYPLEFEADRARALEATDAERDLFDQNRHKFVRI